MTDDVMNDLPVTPVPIFDDEVACREWMQAVHLHGPTHFDVMLRIGELSAVLDDPDINLAAWRIAERLKLTEGAFRMPKEAITRVSKLIEKGRATAFGAELHRRGYDADHRIIWMIHTHARPATVQEVI
jgi:hypothetical protein